MNSNIFCFFIKAILEMNDNLSIICEPGDTQIVDRGFRDVASVFEGIMEKGRKKKYRKEKCRQEKMRVKLRI